MKIKPTRTKSCQVVKPSVLNSEKTATRKLPRLFNAFASFRKGTKNLDLGAGKYHAIVTSFLSAKGVRNTPYDPYYFCEGTNNNALGMLYDTVTVSNVLNVIPSNIEVHQVVSQAYRCLKVSGVAVFAMYEGDKSSVGKYNQSRKTYQRHSPTASYLKVIQAVFKAAELKNRLIVAHK